MEAMLQLSERDQTTPEHPEPESVSRRGVGGALQATSTRRALMLTALGALLIAGIVTAAPIGERGPLGRYTAAEGLRPVANPTFADATAGSCITWPDNSPDTAAVADCNGDHRFEVAESIDLRTYPGTEYGPDAAPPSPARIQQISAEQCRSVQIDWSIIARIRPCHARSSQPRSGRCGAVCVFSCVVEEQYHYI
jgi:hypothetical protein